MNPIVMKRLLLLVIVLAGVGFAVAYRDRIDIEVLKETVSSAGIWGPILFMLIYAIGTVFFLPGLILTMAGGVIFGPYLGTFYNLTAATIGAGAAFLVARYIAGDWVQKKAGKRTEALMNGVNEEGWKFVAFVRLVPLFPFNLLNYALGLTQIRFWTYFITSYIAMLPGAIAYTYLGYAGGAAASGDEETVKKVMIAFALLAVVGFLPSLIKRLRGNKNMDIDKKS